MPRFFQPMSSPLQFESPKVAQGTSVSSPREPKVHVPTDEERKRAAIAKAKSDAVVDGPGTVQTKDGMTLNVPQKQYSQEAYYENLAKAGYPDFAQEEQKRVAEMQQQELVLQNKQLDHMLRTAEVAVNLAYAKDPQGAFITANQFLPKGQRLTEPPRVLDDDHVFIRTEDNPEGERINRRELAAMQADAKARSDRWLPITSKRVGKSEIGTQRHALTGEEKKVYEVDFSVADEKTAAKASPLRQQYLHDKRTQDYLLRGNQYTTLLAANEAGSKSTDKRGVSDIALVFAYMRTLDPQSTVRESEAESVRAATGIPERVRTMALKVMQGDGLSVEQRQEILSTARSVYESSKTIHDTGVKPMFDEYAKNIGVPANTVTGNPNFETTIEKYHHPDQTVKKSGYPAANVEEVEKRDPKSGRIVVYDAKTKKALRFKDGS